MNTPEPWDSDVPFPQHVVMEYYRKFFAPFGNNVLFEVYDVSSETFVIFFGNERSKLMNKETIIKNLTDLSLKTSPLFADIIVLVYNDTSIDFDNPVFIGSKDAYKDG